MLFFFQGFYTVYRHVFETIANEDKPFLDKDEEAISAPHFGYSNSSYEEVSIRTRKNS